MKKLLFLFCLNLFYIGAEPIKPLSEKELRAMIRNNDASTLKAAITTTNINTPKAPLPHKPIKLNLVECAQLLNDVSASRATANAKKSLNAQLLQEAIKLDHVDCVKVLIEHGVRGWHYNDPKYNGYCSLHFAVEFNSKETLKYLIKQKANLESKNADQETPLLVAARKNNANMVLTLMDSGAKINARSKQGYSIIDYAQSHKNFALIAMIINRINPKAPIKFSF